MEYLDDNKLKIVFIMPEQLENYQYKEGCKIEILLIILSISLLTIGFLILVAEGIK